MYTFQSSSSDMTDIDIFAMSTADKILSVSFIISITMINLSLIFKAVRQQKFVYRPKNLIVISLAFGDLLFALFPLVITARIAYGDTFVLGCTTNLTFRVYSSYLIHFVYGFGLVMMAVELCLRYRGQPAMLSTNPGKGFGYSSVPWILGLIVVLPLTMSDYNYTYCSFINVSYSRLQAMFGVSVIMPSVMSVIACGIVCRKRFNAEQSQTYIQTPPSSTPGVVLSTQNTAYAFQKNPDNKVPLPADQTPYIQPAHPTQNFQQQNIYPQSQTPYTQPAYNQYSTQYTQQQNMYPPPAAQYAPPPYPATEQVNQTNVVIPASNYQFQTQNTAAPSVEDPSREKKILLIAAIIYSMCVLPNAIYQMGILVPKYSISSVDVVVSEILVYLMIFRSLVTPCLFMSSFKK